MKRKSRYLTIRAAIQSPKPNDAATASNRKNGRSKIVAGGTNRYQNIKKTRKAPEMRKSTKRVMTELPVMMSRGKYTFEIKSEFDMRLFPLSPIAVEKNCHG